MEGAELPTAYIYVHYYRNRLCCNTINLKVKSYREKIRTTGTAAPLFITDVVGEIIFSEL